MGFNRIAAQARAGQPMPRPFSLHKDVHPPMHRDHAQQAPVDNKIIGKLRGMVNALRELVPSLPGDFRQAGHGLRHAPEPVTAVPVPQPPLSLRRYIGSTGYNPDIAAHLQRVEKYIKNNDLRRYEGLQNSQQQIGRGSSKDVYDLGNGHVMLVKERSGARMADELMNLNLLRAAGFPVVRTLEAGTVRSRYASGNGVVGSSQAMVQQKLGKFYTFERVNPEMHREFMASPAINRNTLASLRHIQKQCREQGVSIHDLQGAVDPRSGVFRIADPTTVSQSSEGDFMKKTRDRNLEKLIRAVAAKVGR